MSYEDDQAAAISAAIRASRSARTGTASNGGNTRVRLPLDTRSNTERFRTALGFGSPSSASRTREDNQMRIVDESATGRMRNGQSTDRHNGY